MQGADASVRDGEGRTALHHAVMRGHLAAVDALTAHAGPALLLQKDILGCTPVHLAAVQNQVTLILKLVSALLKDEGGLTPLHVIARQRCMQVLAPNPRYAPSLEIVPWGVTTAHARMPELMNASSALWARVISCSV